MVTLRFYAKEPLFEEAVARLWHEGPDLRRDASWNRRRGDLSPASFSHLKDGDCDGVGSRGTAAMLKRSIRKLEERVEKRTIEYQRANRELQRERLSWINRLAKSDACSSAFARILSLGKWKSIAASLWRACTADKRRQLLIIVLSAWLTRVEWWERHRSHFLLGWEWLVIIEERELLWAALCSCDFHLH